VSELPGRNKSERKSGLEKLILKGRTFYHVVKAL